MVNKDGTYSRTIAYHKFECGRARADVQIRYNPNTGHIGVYAHNYIDRSHQHPG